MFSSLTVEENLTLAFRQRAGRGQLGGEPRRGPTRPSPSWASAASRPPGTLSGGQQRLLSLAKVLVVPPKLLVADELSLGLAPVVVDAVYEGLRGDQPQRHGDAGGRAAGRPGAEAGQLGRSCWTTGRVAYEGSPAGAASAVEQLLSRVEQAGARAAALVEESGASHERGSGGGRRGR